MKANNVVIDPTEPRHKVHASAPDGTPDCHWNTQWQDSGHGGHVYVQTSRPVNCQRCLFRQRS
jgi:hypothetical protein